MLSSELLERYKNGEREFSNINLQYFDMFHTILKDIIVRDSKIFCVGFNRCDFTNAKFINCEIFFCAFYTCKFYDAVFEKCSIDLTHFENPLVKNTKILKSHLSLSAIFNTNLGELDLSSSIQFKVLTDPSQITQDFVNQAMHKLVPITDSFDISIKATVKKNLIENAKKYGVEIRNPNKAKSIYEGPSRSSYKNQFAYGAVMQSFIDTVISAYNAAHPYQAKKKGYDTQKEY